MPSLIGAPAHHQSLRTPTQIPGASISAAPCRHCCCWRRALRVHAAAPAATQQRRSNLVKQRVPPRKKRFKQSLDLPRRLDVRPSDPEFEGRIATELNSVYGPRKLTKILDDFGPHLTAGHLASAISVLAGLVTGKTLQEGKLEGQYRAPARHCAELLRAKVWQATHIDCARAAYGLARLRVHDPELLPLLVSHTMDLLVTFTPESLAGLAAGLGAWGHRPPEVWLERFALESFARLSQFNAQELANTLFGLTQMGQRPSEVWLTRCLQLFRAQWGGPRCHAPSLVKVICALAVLNARPGFNWTCAFLAEARRQIDRLNPREMASLLWALARLKQQPDAIFVDAWCRSAALRMNAFPPDALALAVHALGAVAPAGGGVPGGVPGRFAGRLLGRCREVVEQLGGAELAQMLWGLASLRLRPEDEWLEACMAALEQQLLQLDPQALADAAWALARMRASPPQPWMDALFAAIDQQLGTMGAAPLAVLLWAVARLRHRPKREWLLAFKGKVGAQYEGTTGAQLTRFIAVAVAGQQRQVQEGVQRPGAPQQEGQQGLNQQQQRQEGQQQQRRRARSTVNGRQPLFGAGPQ